MRSVLITGVQGVGKSTVAHIVSGLLGIDSLNYADLMLEADPTIERRDTFISWSRERRSNLHRLVESMLPDLFGPNSRDVERLALFENHLSIYHDSQLKTFSHDNIARYAPIAILVLESRAEEIASRRRLDDSRLRSIESVSQIEAQQSPNWYEAESIAARYGLPLARIENLSPEATAGKIASWLEKLTRPHGHSDE